MASEHYDGFLRFFVDLVFQGTNLYDLYLNRIKDLLKLEYKINTKYFLTIENQKGLITITALSLLEEFCLDFSIKNNLFFDNHLVSQYDVDSTVDLAEFKKYNDKGLDVLVEGFVPIIGTKEEIKTIKEYAIDDFYFVLNEIGRFYFHR